MAKSVKITIQPPNFKSVTLRVEGTAPLLVHKFSEKSRRQMEENQTSENTTKKKRKPKDYDAEYRAAKYVSSAKWEGVPAASFRMAMINSCRMLDGLPMTKARSALYGSFGMARRGAARHGTAWRGGARRGQAGHGMARRGRK